MATDLASWFRSGGVPQNCLFDLGTVGVTPNQLAARLGELGFHNGFQSKTPLANLLRAGSASYDAAVQRNLLPGSSFGAGNGIIAMTALNGPDHVLSPSVPRPAGWLPTAEDRIQ